MNLSSSSTEKLVLVDVRKEWGEERAYPSNDTAKTFCLLTRTKTLSREQLTVIQSLGYEVRAEISWRL